MSDLQRVLRDPSQPLESTLSFLFNAGEADLFYQCEIFQHLNLWDALSLRTTNSRLDQMVRGVSLWATHDAQGNIIYTRNRPPNTTTPVIRNSNLQWLGVTCNGERFPERVPCTTMSLTNRQVKRCSEIPNPLNRNPTLRLPYAGDTCRDCATSSADYLNPIKADTMNRARRTGLCGQCQLPRGETPPPRPLAWPLELPMPILDSRRLEMLPVRTRNRKTTFKQKHESNVLDLEPPSRSSREVFHDSNRRRRANLPCPGNARSSVRRHPGPSHVIYCMSCHGIIVKSIEGPIFSPRIFFALRPRDGLNGSRLDMPRWRRWTL